MKMINLFIFFFLCTASLFAQDITGLPAITKDDRILILAPHPDDETIGAGGVIQKALKANAAIKVVWLTNGDNNELAFIVYKKRIVFSKNELLHLGEVRRQEAIAAMKVLGLRDDQMAFLGYPDFGTLEVFKRYWGDTKPFKSMLTRVRNVPYQDSPSYNALYVGESILNDLRKILKDFQPTKIFTTLPSDINADHRAAHLFLQVALWDLENKIPPPECYSFLVHSAKWPVPRGFHPKEPLLPPKVFSNSQIEWKILDLTPEEIKKKNQAIAVFKTQIEYSPSYLFSFNRKNELFGKYKTVNLQQAYKGTIDWEDIKNQWPIEGNVIDEKNDDQHIDSVVYAIKDNFLYVRIKLKNWRSELMGLNLYNR